MNALSHRSKLRIIDGKHLLVGTNLEVAVAVRKSRIVAHSGIEIALVELRDEAVYVATTLVCRVADER